MPPRTTQSTVRAVPLRGYYTGGISGGALSVGATTNNTYPPVIEQRLNHQVTIPNSHGIWRFDLDGELISDRAAAVARLGESV